MSGILDKHFFPFVEKPARYIGCEPGSIVKDPQDRVQIILSYPDLYEVGMSYHGLQILYHLINRQNDALCERVFAPAADAEAILREKKIDLFSLESGRPLKEFDLIGFTLSYELVYTNLLNILDLAGLELESRNRSDDHPLIAAGGPICQNPEPMSDFIDFFFIGEAEEAISDIVKILKESKGSPRREKLKRLAGIDGVYVPEFYKGENHTPVFSELPAQIMPRHADKLRPEYYPDKPLVPLLETTHDRVAVEIMRGCPQNCLFCQAGKIYKPVRLRSVSDIKKQALSNIEATGYDEVSLLSLSTTDYPRIGELIKSLTEELASKKVSVALPSLRPASFTQEIADAVKTTRRTGLTFAPEVGTERLRKVIRKRITDQELLAAVEAAFDRGWNHIKLYFMIGLPTETQDDLDGIALLIDKVVLLGRASRGQKKINVTISPFSAKAHTPFQWDRICSPDEIAGKQKYLSYKIKAREVNLKFRDPQVSYLEGVLGRGGREIGSVILQAFRQGARLDGWSEYFDFNRWAEAFQSAGLEMADYAHEISFSKPLPWDIVDRRPGKERLQQERTQASEKAFADDMDQITTAENSGETNSNDNQLFGRKKKRVVASQSSLNPTRGKIRLKWGKKGRARFMSHLDNARAFERAIRRSGLPVLYSQGFHPHQKLSFGPPLPLGYSSDSEYLDIFIEGMIERDQIKKLGQALPLGFFITEDRLIYSKAPAISTLLNLAEYQVRNISIDKEIAQRAIDELLLRESIIATRATKDGGKEVEIRPAIYRLELRSDGQGPILEMELGLGEAGYARPTEVIESLGVFTPEEILSGHFHRRALIYRDKVGANLDPLTAIA